MPSLARSHDLVATVSSPKPVDQSPPHVYMARMAEGSRRSMQQSLQIVAGILTGERASAAEIDWSAVRYQHAQAVRAVLAERYSPTTANRHLSALRGVLREAWRLGQMTAEHFHRAIDVENVKGDRLPAGRGLPQSEISALFKACADSTPAGARDAAIIGIAYGAGLRRAELANLDVADFNPDSGVRVIGKRNNERQVSLPAGSVRAVEAWLEIRGDSPGPLFNPVDKGGRVHVGKPMSDAAIYQRLQTRAARAGVANVTPHDLRRSLASDHLDMGTDVFTVQRILGHASPSTTARYDRRDEHAQQRAARRLHVPYISPK